MDDKDDEIVYFDDNGDVLSLSTNSTPVIDTITSILDNDIDDGDTGNNSEILQSTFVDCTLPKPRRAPCPDAQEFFDFYRAQGEFFGDNNDAIEESLGLKLQHSPMEHLLLKEGNEDIMNNIQHLRDKYKYQHN